MLERTWYTDGLGAIYPAMMYSMMALESLGHADDQPDFLEALRHSDGRILEARDYFPLLALSTVLKKWKGN